MRIPKPWFRDQTKSLYVKIGRVQHALGKDKKEADKVYHRLMAAEGLATPIKDLPLGGLIEQFLADSEKDVTSETASWYRRFLDDFSSRYPRLKPADIAPRHVRAWVNADHKRPWGQSTQRSAITILKRLVAETENPRARLAAELLASDAYGSTVARVKAFVEQGGGCRATFFNHRQKLSGEPGP